MTSVEGDDSATGGGHIEKYYNYYVDISNDNSTLFPPIEKEIEEARSRSNETLLSYAISELLFIVGVILFCLIIFGHKLIKTKQELNSNVTHSYSELSSADIENEDYNIFNDFA